MDDREQTKLGSPKHLRVFGVVSQLLIAAVFLLSSRASAVLCMTNNGEINSGYDYFDAVVEVLVQLKNATETFETARKDFKKDKNFDTNLMVALKTMRSYYECGISTLKRYQPSSNEMISGGSKKMEESINALIGFVDYNLGEFKKLVSGNDKEDAGKKADRDSDVLVATNEAWSHIGLAATSATWAVVSEPGKNDGKESRMKLLITEEQKKRLITKLEDNFGKKPKARENQAPVLIAQNLLKFLRQKF